MKKYFCPECDKTFSKFGRLLDHMRQTKHLSSTCKDCDKVLITTRSQSMHNDETEHGEFTGIVRANNIRELQNLTRIDAEVDHEESEKVQLYISIDAQNVVLKRDIVALIHILKQLNLFAEKLGFSPRLETVVPLWMIERKGKYDYNEKVKQHTRLIKLFVDSKDKEIDDYLVVSLAAVNDGYYLSNDKKMHEHLGKNDEWRDDHRIGISRISATNEMRLNFPEGKLSVIYDELLEKGELKVEFDEWENDIIAATIEKEKLKEDSLPKKYFCPECDEKFPKLRALNNHRSETGHASLTCDECGEFLRSEKQHKEHKSQTGHSSYSGEIINNKEMRIEKSEEKVVEKSPQTPAITNGASNQNELSIWGFTASSENKKLNRQFLFPSNPAVTSAILHQIKSFSENEISWNECRTQVAQTHSLSIWKFNGIIVGLRTIVWQMAGDLAAGRWRDQIDWNHISISPSTIEALQEITLNHQWSDNRTPPKNWVAEVSEYFEEVKNHYIAS